VLGLRVCDGSHCQRCKAGDGISVSCCHCVQAASSSLSLPRQQNYLQQQLRLLLPVSPLIRLRRTSKTSTYSFRYQTVTATNNLTPALTYFFKVSNRINVFKKTALVFTETNCTATVCFSGAQ